jgi:hypothetical protein
MPDMAEILNQVHDEMAGEFRARLRHRLSEQPVEWLVDQVLTLTLDGNHAPARTARNETCTSVIERLPEESEQDRAARVARLRLLDISEDTLPIYSYRYQALTRETLEKESYLINPPHKGGGLIPPQCRSPKGETLLVEAKDLLHALLFGGEEEGIQLNRTEREILTITIPRTKLHSIAFLMRAATEIGVEGTWRDPQRMADDDRADNTLVQVEYGEVAGELVGSALVAVLRLINNLEINEQVLYARMENVEENALDA